jgi:hypothetical protein
MAMSMGQYLVPVISLADNITGHAVSSVFRATTHVLFIDRMRRFTDLAAAELTGAKDVRQNCCRRRTRNRRQWKQERAHARRNSSIERRLPHAINHREAGHRSFAEPT